MEGSKKTECQANSFRCEDGQCIPNTWHCDTQQDCEGGEDEKNCGNYCVNEFEYFLSRSSTSINDYNYLCADYTCNQSQFLCKSGECISHMWRCDGKFCDPFFHL